MRKIGIVASGSTEIAGQVILAEGEEKLVKTEDLVLIHNRNGNEVMAVCRGGLGSNENLKVGATESYGRCGYVGLISEGDMSQFDADIEKLISVYLQ